MSSDVSLDSVAQEGRKDVHRPAELPPPLEESSRARSPEWLAGGSAECSQVYGLQLGLPQLGGSSGPCAAWGQQGIYLPYFPSHLCQNEETKEDEREEGEEEVE